MAHASILTFIHSSRGVQFERHRYSVKPTVKEAEQLLQKHGCTRARRTLDTLHLATYALISEPEWRFVVADDRLYDVTRQEQHALIHPLRQAADE